MRFDTPSVELMENSLDAQWLRMRVISHNISQFETPGYKTKSVTFGQVLEQACKSPLHGGSKKTNGAISRATITTDEFTEARVDGNNVSMEREQLELTKAQIQYDYLVSKVNGHYSSIRNVISQMSR